MEDIVISGGDKATIAPSDAALKVVADLFGVDSAALIESLIIQKMKIAGTLEEIPFLTLTLIAGMLKEIPFLTPTLIAGTLKEIPLSEVTANKFTESLAKVMHTEIFLCLLTLALDLISPTITLLTSPVYLTVTLTLMSICTYTNPTSG